LSYARDADHDTGKRAFAQLESSRLINGFIPAPAGTAAGPRLISKTSPAVPASEWR